MTKTDMRKGMNTLSGLIHDKMESDVRNGDVFIFINGRKTRMTLTEKGKGVLIAPMPPMPIYKGLPGSSLLTELFLMKYEYHIPFYRQKKYLNIWVLKYRTIL